MATVKFAANAGSSARTLTLRSASGSRPLTLGEVVPTPLRDWPAATSAPTVVGERRGFRRGDSVKIAGSSYIRVERGTLAIFRQMAERRSICVALMGPGDVFRVSNAENVQVEALTDTHVVAFNNGGLIALLTSSPASAEQVLTSLADRIERLETAVQRVLGRDISVRLAGMLLELSDHCGQPLGDGMTEISIAMPHKLLARMIGGNRVTITRVMSDLRDAGMVSSPRRNRVHVNVDVVRTFLAAQTA